MGHSKGNKTPGKNNMKIHCHKKNSVSMFVDDYEKSSEIDVNKFSSNRTMKHKNANKENDNNNRIISNVIPNSKFPLTSKNHLAKKITASTLPRKFMNNKNSFNSNGNHSFINVRGNSRE